MNNTEIVAFGAAVALSAGLIAAIAIFGVLFYILMVIAMWKMFEKAGEAGWKALIPIYDVYIFCKIIGVNFWIWVLLIPLVLGVISAIPAVAKDANQVMSIITLIYTIIFDIYMCYKLAKSFDKGIGYTIGLFFFPNIFQLILAFGSAEYVGTGK